MIKNFLLKYLFNAVVISDIISFEKGKIYINRELITDEQRNIIKEEAKYIGDCLLWRLLTSTLAEGAKKMMFEKSQSFDNMMSGKMLLYAVDIQQKILDELKK